MQNVFNFRQKIIDDYSDFSRSFTRIQAEDIATYVDAEYDKHRYWPEPLIQINPNYQRAGDIKQLVNEGILNPLCEQIFCFKDADGGHIPLRLFQHQQEALSKAANGESYVVTTGTGSGKSLAFFIPIINRVIEAKVSDKEPKTRAIIIYPMNALANSQLEEIHKFLGNLGDGQQQLTVGRYTGQESPTERERIANNPPDILLTNYMMLELILTRYEAVDRRVVENCKGLEFLVLDELHTYRGRQGADVALLVRRLRERFNAEKLICIGTSATMSSTGSTEDRKVTVAKVASKLFGQAIPPSNVIAETLERATDKHMGLESVKPQLKQAVETPSYAWGSIDEFVKDPLSVWVELTLGLQLFEDRAPERAQPKSLSVASAQLAEDAGVDPTIARRSLEAFLLAAQSLKTPDGRSPFAFKLHQFISGPGKVQCTLEADNQRVITLDSQRFAPSRQEDQVFLYNTHFCRECGQEYHPVWENFDNAPDYSPREIDDVGSEDRDGRFGFLAPIRPEQDFQGDIENYPDIWLDTSKDEPKLKQHYKQYQVSRCLVDVQGSKGSGKAHWFIPGHFRFCVHCSNLHEARGRDINRLSGLSGEGRSSATTMLTLSTLREMYAQADASADGLQSDPRKLLGFSDNRQDAALQAGHFNDFIFLLIIRAGLIGALRNNSAYLAEDRLSESVFEALSFDDNDPGTLSEYLRDPTLLGLGLKEAQKALRFVIGYRLINDLRKGWRYNNPNLHQLNILELQYEGLADFCEDEASFKDNDVLARMSPSERQQMATIVFDELVKNLCLESRFLDGMEHERIRGKIYNFLTERWSFGDDEKLATTKYMILGKRPDNKGRARQELISGGPRSKIISLLRNADFWTGSAVEEHIKQLKNPELVELLKAFLQSAERHGYVQSQGLDKNQLIGWTLKSSALLWHLLPDDNSNREKSQNAFFRELYNSVANILTGPTHPLFDFEAHEHTAQVEPARRQQLEARFRRNERDHKEWAENPDNKGPMPALPILYCSPTMELGVDISSLNTVYLRNVPPTPANYAQRSGRAGRSGQAALVITYCAAMSPHDQWFFHNANEMVHGVVKAPTLELSNRDLVESHLHAVWLANVEYELHTSIAPMLNLESEAKEIIPELNEQLIDPAVTQRAMQKASRVIDQIRAELTPENAPWFSESFVEQVIQRAAKDFNDAFDRWRSLYDGVQKQMDSANKVIQSPSTTARERENANRRYQDAKNQFTMLLKTGNSQNNDFYTFRYLASQGFLPGYNFPRLPLMAWIPSTGRKIAGREDRGSMVSRPRFLALSEFGPRSLIYHEGRMFRVDKAKLNIHGSDSISADSSLATVSARVCTLCGYGHLGDDDNPEPLEDNCEHCHQPLVDEGRINSLYRIETVETRVQERISVNEEDRQRQGYDLQTTYRFIPGANGVIEVDHSNVVSASETIAKLTYSPSARIWRVNKGWRRRKDKEQLGFYINPITGQWSKQEDPTKDDDPEAKKEKVDEKQPVQRIVPFVEDHRNILIFTPSKQLPEMSMATLQSAMKRGIAQTFQIEESELVVEPLPDRSDRRALLFYEAAEGGAGVLSRICHDAEQLAIVAREAFKVMHFDLSKVEAFTFEDLEPLEIHKSNGERICEAGCYQCLLSYYNQPDHDLISRRDPFVLKILAELANGAVNRTKNVAPTEDSTTALNQWLGLIAELGLAAPDETQVELQEGTWVVDALYKSARTLILLSEPSKDLQAYASDRAYSIISFNSDSSTWRDTILEHPDVFGSIPTA